MLIKIKRNSKIHRENTLDVRVVIFILPLLAHKLSLAMGVFLSYTGTQMSFKESLGAQMFFSILLDSRITKIKKFIYT
jgi:hypothetical protein